MTLDFIFDDAPLGIKNDWSNEAGNFEAQDPLKEVNIA